MIRSAYYIDLDGNLVSKNIGNLFSFASDSRGVKNGAFDSSDYGRRFRVSFRVYDETSRVLSLTNGNGYDFGTSTADFKGTNYSFYTTAGKWTTVTYEFTIDDEMYYGDTLRKQVMLFSAENKSIAVLDEDAAVNIRNMAGATSKPGNYAGEAGLNSSYNKYNNVDAALAAGKVTYYEDFSYGLYIDDIVFEEITTSVNLSSSLPMLSISPTTDYNVLPNVSSSVLATDPNAGQNGLWVSGGQSGIDTDSVKSYVKLSLNGYAGGYAGFLFRASSEGKANISVYGVADVNAGQGWTPDNITTENAPANDIYGSGVNLNDVYGHAPLTTVTVGAYDNTYRVDLTNFAEYMRSKGATEITLILVSDAKNTTEIEIVDKVDPNIIDTYNCVTTKPGVGAAGYTIVGGELYRWDADGLHINLNTVNHATNKDHAIRLSVFDKIWADESYVGKTIQVTFSAKASETGRIDIALRQRIKYAFKDFPGLSGSANLTTTWQTFSYKFVVTQEMYDIITNANDNNGIQPPGLALGIGFTGFADVDGTYSGAQINFRNFVVSLSEEPLIEPIYKKHFDFSTTKTDVDSRGYAKDAAGTNLQIPTIQNEEIYIRRFNEIYASNTKQFVRVNAFKEVFANSTYVGKTFTVSFRAKASESGVIDVDFHKLGTWDSYTDKDSSGNTIKYNHQFELSTEYQTFSFDFVVTQGMVNETTYPINLAFRFYNGFLSKSIDETFPYKNVEIYIDDIILVSYDDAASQTLAASEEPVATISETSYVRTFEDVTYDFSTSVPAVTYLGYAGQTIASVKNGQLFVNLANATNAPNEGQPTFVDVLGAIWADRNNIGKTFSISFRARATEAGIVGFGLNASNNTSAFKNYQQDFAVATEYRTFTYTFTVTDDMYTSYLQGSFRFNNGFANGNTYKNAQIYIDDIRVFQDFYIEKTTLPIVNTQAVNADANNGKLYAYAANSAIKADIMKSYFSYDLTSVSGAVSAKLNIDLLNANGETVRVYILPETTLPANLTYANAPKPLGAATYTFTASNGLTVLDMLDVVVANQGTNIVVIFAIEHLSGDVMISVTPELDIVTEHHDYTSESQRHEAKAPTYNTSGNIEFYSCAGCGKLYVKNDNGDFVEIDAEDIVLPPIEYSTEFSHISLNIGKDLSVRYYVTLSEGEGIEGFSARFTLNDEAVEVTDATFDTKTGKYVFTFCGIAPQLMGDTITAELLKNGQLIDQKDYSVRQYVEKALELYPDDVALKQLLADLLHYGAAAQQYIGYKADQLVTDGLGLTASGATPTEADKQKTVSQSTNSNVQFTAAGVRFDYINRIYVKFKATDINGVTVSVGGVNLEILETSTAGVYIAYSDAISALRFSDKFTFTLSVGGSAVQTLVYTVNDYAYAKHSDSRISDLALALYRYGKSALAYNSSN